MNGTPTLAPTAVRAPSASIWALALVMAGAAFFALLFGLVATTANPVLVAVAVAAVFGAVLFARPLWGMWLMVGAGLLVAGLIPIWAEGFGRKAAWAVSILGFALMASSLFRAATVKSATQRTPAFVWLSLIFMVYAILVSLVQWSGPIELFGGVKRYFQTFGLMFLFVWLVVTEQTVERLRKFMLVVALVQLPFALYERLSLVPFRRAVAAAYPGMVPIDVVAGTFGAQMYAGGANAEMASFLVIVCAFLVARYREGQLPGRRLALLLPVVLAPLFMGETKIIIVLMPMVFAILYKREILARPHVAIAGSLVGIALTAAAGYAYSVAMQKSVSELFETTVSYNLGEHGYGSAYLNRTSVITHWFSQQGLDDPVSAIVGNGLGASHDATGGHVAERYMGYQISLTAASTLLWDLGIVGITLFFLILGLAWLSAGRLRKRSDEPAVRADAAAIQCAMAVFAVYVFYRIALLETLSFQIVFGLTLGYLAWLYRRHLQGRSSARA